MADEKPRAPRARKKVSDTDEAITKTAAEEEGDNDDATAHRRRPW